MPTSHSARVSRRTFLAGVGTGAVMAATSSLPLAGAFAQSRPRHFVLRENRFGRIFPNLPPFAEVSPALDAALRDIGKPGGILDAKDNLLAGPVQLIVDPALSTNNPNNPTHTAGTTFMGQFMDHDITFDLASRLGVPTNPAASANSRTPAGRTRIPNCTRAGAADTGRSNSGSRAMVNSKTCRVTPPARRSSPTPATTRT
jgi:hypothetical protein